MFGINSNAAKRGSAQNIKVNQKRQYSRRTDDQCVSIINGQMHPVRNWSSGGVMIMADDRLFGVGMDCVVTLKFKLRDEILEIDHKGKVVRKGDGQVAVKFAPPCKDVQRKFQKVVDDFVSQKFAESYSG